MAAGRVDALPAARGRDSRSGGSRRVPARPRPLRLVVRGHRRQRHRRRRAPGVGARAVVAARSTQTLGADRVVARPLDWPLCRLHVVCRHVRRRTRRALHRAARHRLAGLRRCDRVRRSDVDGGSRCAVPELNTRRARPARAARAATPRRRLLVQPDRAHGPVHAPVQYSDRGAKAARLLRRRRLRRQYRVAHARRPHAGRRSRHPAARSRRLLDDDRADRERAPASVRLRRRHR